LLRYDKRRLEVARALPKLNLQIGPKTQRFLNAVNATGNPGRDNELIEEFVASETDPFRVQCLKKDSEQSGPESPWQVPHIEEYVVDLVRLCHWHYLETKNPLFLYWAINVGQHLTVRTAHYLDWTRDYLVHSAVLLAFLVKRPPEAAEAQAAFAAALGFVRSKYENPFRQARSLIEDGEIYRRVRGLERTGKNITDAINTVSEDCGVSYGKAREIYYRLRKLGQTDPTNFNMATLLNLDPPSF
jgi:hypothetical protein